MPPLVNKAAPKHVYLGIDPGASGGLAWVSASSSQAVAMPKTERDVWDLFAWKGANGQLIGAASFAVIEAVHSFPGQGVASTFAFGRSYGFLRACLIAAEIPFEEVQPRVWQKVMGILKRDKDESKTAFKNRLKAKAQQLFPTEKVTLATSDALLLAEYCRRKIEGRL